MKKVASGGRGVRDRGRRRVVIGDDDPKLTLHAGLSLVAELDRVLGIGSAIDEAVGPIKGRRQGLGAGGLVLAMAETMLAGGDFMCDLDVQRDDVAGRPLRAVPDIPSSPTFIGLTKQFDTGVFGGIETANGEVVGRWFAVLDVERRRALVGPRPTLDLDPTDVEVYGAKKQGFAYNHTGSWWGARTPRCGPKPAWCWPRTSAMAVATRGPRHRA